VRLYVSVDGGEPGHADPAPIGIRGCIARRAERHRDEITELRRDEPGGDAVTNWRPSAFPASRERRSYRPARVPRARLRVGLDLEQGDQAACHCHARGWLLLDPDAALSIDRAENCCSGCALCGRPKAGAMVPASRRRVRLDSPSIPQLRAPAR